MKPEGSVDDDEDDDTLTGPLPNPIARTRIDVHASDKCGVSLPAVVPDL